MRVDPDIFNPRLRLEYLYEYENVTRNLYLWVARAFYLLGKLSHR